MSLSLKIELSAATIQAIPEAAKGDDATALQTVRALTDRAVLDAVKKFQYVDLTATAGPTDTFQIFIKRRVGVSLALEVNNNSTIQKVKEDICTGESSKGSFAIPHASHRRPLDMCKKASISPECRIGRLRNLKSRSSNQKSSQSTGGCVGVLK